MDYVDLDELKTTLSLTGESFADDDLTLAITSASAIVDSTCGRSFDPVATATRTYVAARTRWVEIDDVQSVTAITSTTYSSETTWATTDYDLEPLDPGGLPYTALRLTPQSLVYDLTPGVTRVEVTGSFGWPGSVPSGVKQATKVLASRLLKRVREAPFGIAGAGMDGMPVRVSKSDPDVALLLTPYTRELRLS